MTEKRFVNIGVEWVDGFIQDHIGDRDLFNIGAVCKLLNELHEEKEWLEMNNKDLVSFIKSKGYTLKDFLKYVGQFRSVGANKEDWND